MGCTLRIANEEPDPAQLSDKRQHISLQIVKQAVSPADIP